MTRDEALAALDGLSPAEHGVLLKWLAMTEPGRVGELLAELTDFAGKYPESAAILHGE